MSIQTRNPMWTCSWCGGTRRPAGRVDGKVQLVCTSCSTVASFDSMDKAVQEEQRLAQLEETTLELVLAN